MATPYCWRLGQIEAQAGCLADKKLMRNLHQDACPIAGRFVGPRGPAVHQVQKHLFAVLDNIVIPASGYVYYRANSTRIVLELRIVQALGFSSN